ncbi:MAG: hypothetical protein GF355_04855 [Candidatus Eisenbacteria bacterium]|nr:hypothetical protein [Candidatus Eisenbacteria bacterium]
MSTQPRSSAASRTPPRGRWLRIALWLVVGTMAYNAVEAIVALAAGVSARSIALVGFGLDSMIELAAAGFVLWRLRVEAMGASPAVVERAESRVGRFVGWTFILLALYVTVQSIWILAARRTPEESWLGLALATASLVVMPLVALAKLRAAREIGSGSLRAEAKETLACSYLSLCLFLGLGANAVAGWWWADPSAALLMVPWLIKEGLEGIRGDPCAC